MLSRWQETGAKDSHGTEVTCGRTRASLWKLGSEFGLSTSSPGSQF